MRTTTLFLALALAPAVAGADSHHTVVPPAERELAARKMAEGPTENRGIESIVPLAAVPLAGEIEGAGNRVLRAREITVAPGGVVAVHQHQGRPGVAYVIEGEIWEHRSDTAGPVLRKAGAASYEKTGVTHWWENRSGAKVRALVVDILPQP